MQDDNQVMIKYMTIFSVVYVTALAGCSSLPTEDTNVNTQQTQASDAEVTNQTINDNKIHIIVQTPDSATHEVTFSEEEEANVFMLIVKLGGQPHLSDPYIRIQRGEPGNIRLIDIDITDMIKNPEIDSFKLIDGDKVIFRPYRIIM